MACALGLFCAGTTAVVIDGVGATGSGGLWPWLVVPACIGVAAGAVGGGRWAVLLAVAVVIAGLVTGLRVGYSRRPPRSALPPADVVLLTGRCGTDLRPSSSTRRVLPVELRSVSTRSGWRGSAGGTVVILWEGADHLSVGEHEARMLPVRGDLLRVVIDPGDWDGNRILFVDDAALRLVPARSPWSDARRRSRETVRLRLDRLPAPARGLVRALLLGDRSGLPDELITAVRRAGASHVIALSGMHLAVLAAIVLRMLRPVCPPRPRLAMLVILLGGYVAIAGWIPSLLRALVLTGVTAIATVQDRSPTPEILLARGVLIFALLAPRYLVDVGFQLSVLALGGILFVAPRIVTLLRYAVPRVLASTVGLTLAPMLTTLLITLPLFGAIYPVGLVAAAPLSFVVVLTMWLGILFLVLGSVPLVGTLLGTLLHGVASVFIAMARWAAMVPGIEGGPREGMAPAILWCTMLTAPLAWAYLRRRRHRDRIERYLRHHDQPRLSF